MKVMFCSHMSRLVLIFSVVIWLGGCATQSARQIEYRFDPAKHRAVSIQPCVDRTDYKGDHNLSAEGTQIFTDKVKKTGIFEIQPDALFMLTCDIEQFMEGSALKRWVLPGWGQTQATVSVMAIEKPEEKVVASLRSQSVVGSGGLYTIGADSYILSAAFEDIVNQLKTWATDSGNGRGAGK